MNTWHVLSSVLLGAGVALELLAVLGLSVMRDALDRLHYVSVAGLGVALVAAAVLVRESFSLIGDKAFALGVLMLVLGPVIVQTTARSLRIRDRGDWREGIERMREKEP